MPMFLRKITHSLYLSLVKVMVNFGPPARHHAFAGSGSSRQLCEHLIRTGVSKLLIVTDKPLRDLGVVDRATAALADSGIDIAFYDGVLPDPTYEHVAEGVAIAKTHGSEAILAIGGGSSIDAAKIIAASATSGENPADWVGFGKLKHDVLPLYVIPTTSGTGSEATMGAVISDPVTHEKGVISGGPLLPQVVALDAQLITGLPPHITAATGMDALTHAVEAYLSANALPETDGYALAATKLIMENLPTAVANGKDLEARQAMSFASYYAALAFTRAGVGYVHAISHNFGAYYHTPHGLANAIVMPWVLDFSKPKCTKRMARLAEVAGLRKKGDRPQALANRFIDHIREMNKEFGIPQQLEALKKSDIPAIAASALKEAHYTYAVPRYMDQRTCEGLIRKMLA